MKLKDLPQLNREFRSVRCLCGQQYAEREFSRLCVWTREHTSISPMDLVFVYTEFADAAALSACLEQAERDGAAGVLLRASAGLLLPDRAFSLSIWSLPDWADPDGAMQLLSCARRGETALRSCLLGDFTQQLSQQNDTGNLLALLFDYLRYPLDLFSSAYILPHHSMESPTLPLAKRIWLQHQMEQPEETNFTLVQDGLHYTYFGIQSATDRLASLVVVSGVPLTSTDRFLISVAIPTLAIRLLEELKSEQCFYCQNEDFFRAIYERRFDRHPNRLRANARFLSLECDTPRILWILQPDRPAILENKALLRRLSDYFSSLYRRIVAIRWEDSLVYCMECGTSGEHNLPEFFSSILDSLHGSSLPSRFHLSVSSRFDRLEDAPNALDEALFGLKLGQKLHPELSIYFYEDYLLYHLLDNMSRSASTALIYQEIIPPLIDYDEKNSTDLLATLQALCRCDFNIVETASALYLHRNSLYRRLERICEVLHLSVEDPRHQLSLHLAIKLHELFN